MRHKTKTKNYEHTLFTEKLEFFFAGINKKKLNSIIAHLTTFFEADYGIQI